MLNLLLPAGSMAWDVGQHGFVGAMQAHVHHIPIALFVHIHVGAVAHGQTLEAETKRFEACKNIE